MDLEPLRIFDAVAIEYAMSNQLGQVVIRA